MSLDLSWLIGRSLRNVQKQDHTWFFTLNDASTVATESQWRLVQERVIVTSEDDGQWFGLPSPVDAARLVTQAVGSSVVDHFALDDQTGDLSLFFDNATTLQFITLSGGYEGWRIGHGDQQIICMGGGELAIFGPR
jgi:hypothetical protein